jgi:hypothetical protein
MQDAGCSREYAQWAPVPCAPQVARLWDPEEGRTLLVLRGHTRLIMRVAVLPATGSGDGDGEEGSPDLLVTGSWDGRVSA